MKFAIALSEKEIVVPIVQGSILRIFDNETSQYSDFENPANTVTSGKRGKTITFALEKGVEVFVSPPETFCDLSYDKAKEIGLKFVNVVANLPFDELAHNLIESNYEIVNQLPEVEIVPSV